MLFSWASKEQPFSIFTAYLLYVVIYYVSFFYFLLFTFSPLVPQEVILGQDREISLIVTRVLTSKYDLSIYIWWWQWPLLDYLIRETISQKKKSERTYTVANQGSSYWPISLDTDGTYQSDKGVIHEVPSTKRYHNLTPYQVIRGLYRAWTVEIRPLSTYIDQ